MYEVSGEIVCHYTPFNGVTGFTLYGKSLPEVETKVFELANSMLAGEPFSYTIHGITEMELPTVERVLGFGGGCDS